MPYVTKTTDNQKITNPKSKFPLSIQDKDNDKENAICPRSQIPKPNQKPHKKPIKTPRSKTPRYIANIQGSKRRKKKCLDRPPTISLSLRKVNLPRPKSKIVKERLAAYQAQAQIRSVLPNKPKNSVKSHNANLYSYQEQKNPSPPTNVVYEKESVAEKKDSLSFILFSLA
jgi:hypothetical protein